jgi:putative copper resistance protein D
MLDIWGVASIATKFALYLGILTAVGTVIAALVFRLDRYRGLACGFAVVGLLATMMSFSLGGAMLTGDASGMTDPEMLGLLWSTPVGTALIYRLVGLGLLICGLAMGRVGLWVSVLGGLLAIWSFDHVGHVPDRGTMLLDIALTFHLVAIALWIGILTPLKRLASTPVTWAEAANVGHRFGVVASGTVPLLIIAGGFMTYNLVGSVAAMFSTGYGQALILKVAFVAVLLLLAAANKLRFMPRLQAGDPNAARHLARSISIEWLVILAVLGTTAVLTSNLTLPT